jgi:hypothetical protein
MSANYKTIEKVIKILAEEVGQEKTITVLRRLQRETVPSGNKSYDETVCRLCGVVCG